jgi:hypothetical protein
MATSSVEEREVKIRMRKPLNAAFIQDTLSVLHNLTPEPHQPSSNMSQGNSRTSIVLSNPFILLHAVQKNAAEGLHVVDIFRVGGGGVPRLVAKARAKVPPTDIVSRMPIPIG